MLINLVGNAVKFTREGGVNVEFGWRQGRLDVAICDSGPGIDDTEVAAIFEAYRRAGGTRRSKGAGLGLTISRALVRAMGGDIEVRANAGGGTCFRFHIDADRVRPGGARHVDVLAGRKILLADDDVELSDLLKEYFESEGFAVRVAHDGEQALNESRRPGVDAMVLDIMMPKMNGIEVLRNLRKESELPVIMLTARGFDVDHRELFDAGIKTCVNKPFGPRELLKIVEEALVPLQAPC